MPRRRFAIVTFDPDRLDQLNWQAEGHCFAHSILRGLSGYTYAKERGIINITLMDQVPATDAPGDAEQRAKRASGSGADR